MSLLIGAALLALWQPASAQVGLGLSPMRLELKLGAGAVHSGTLRLVNEGDPTRVRAQLLDFRLDAEQTPQFAASMPSEAEYSCKNWLQVNPMESELQVSGESQIRYTIRVPAGVQARSYYCAVGFTSLPTAAQVKGLGMRSAVRIVSAFYVTVGEPQVQGQLKNIGIESAPGGKSLRAVVTLENSGKRFFRPGGSVIVTDTSGQTLETHEIQPVPILPEREQRLLFPLSKVTEGQPCTIRVKVEVAGEVQEGTAVVQARN